MFDLKPISKEAIPGALAKAEQYRLLNEPRQAESICRDVLRADPDHQDARVTLLLTLTEQFGRQLQVSVNHAQELLPQIDSEYKRVYYAGVVCERWAKAQIEQNTPGYVIFDWLRQAMQHYEEAEKLSPAGNDDAILRWNTCARIIKRNESFRPKPQDQSIEAGYEDEVPHR